MEKGKGEGRERERERAKQELSKKKVLHAFFSHLAPSRFRRNIPSRAGEFEMKEQDEIN